MSRAPGQDVTPHRGRMSLHAFLRIKTPSPCLPKRCLVVARRPVTGLQRDDVYEESGRRDSNPRQPAWKADGRKIAARLP
jgi:hypothetical protein